MERWETIGILMVLPFMISSCQTAKIAKMYAGPELPATEVAFIAEGMVGGVPT